MDSSAESCSDSLAPEAMPCTLKRTSSSRQRTQARSSTSLRDWPSPCACKVTKRDTAVWMRSFRQKEPEALRGSGSWAPLRTARKRACKAALRVDGCLTSSTVAPKSASRIEDPEAGGGPVASASERPSSQVETVSSMSSDASRSRSACTAARSGSASTVHEHDGPTRCKSAPGAITKLGSIG
eukprot:7390224-Prymnesium_polylepis.3